MSVVVWHAHKLASSVRFNHLVDTRLAEEAVGEIGAKEADKSKSMSSGSTVGTPTGD